MPKQKRIRISLSVMNYIIIILTAIALSFLLVKSYYYSIEKKNLEEQLQYLEDGRIEIGKELGVVNESVIDEELAKKVKTVEEERIKILPILRELTSNLPTNGYFNGFQYIKPNEINLSVRFNSMADATYYSSQILNVKEVNNITIDSVTLSDELGMDEVKDVGQDTEDLVGDTEGNKEIEVGKESSELLEQEEQEEQEEPKIESVKSNGDVYYMVNYRVKLVYEVKEKEVEEIEEEGDTEDEVGEGGV